MAKTMNELYRLYGDMTADKAHAEMKSDPNVRDVPSRTDVRSGWKEIRKDGSVIFTGVFETECGRRFLSRQGRWRYCKRTNAIPITIKQKDD